MKDTFRKIIATLLSWTGLATLGLYTYNHSMIVKDYVAQYNYYIIGTLWIIFLAFFLQFGIVVFRGNKLKIKAILAWLVVILMGYYYIKNDVWAGIYAWDIIMVLWVLMIYLTLAWLIVTQKAEKQIEKAKQVVIEV